MTKKIILRNRLGHSTFLFSPAEQKPLFSARSRQQWFGNVDPESQGVVHTSVAHVWPGVSNQLILCLNVFIYGMLYMLHKGFKYISLRLLLLNLVILYSVVDPKLYYSESGPICSNTDKYISEIYEIIFLCYSKHINC